MALVLIGTATGVRAQSRAFLLPDPDWYAGVQAGTSFGQATFSSITSSQMHWGVQGGLFGGYRFNRLISVEAAFQYGAQTQTAQACCTYWLSEDGQRYVAPLLDAKGWFYEDLQTRTQWGRLAVQANFNLLSLVSALDSRWSFNLSPQLALVATKTKLVTPDAVSKKPAQVHLGLGGQASVGYQINDRIQAAFYAGISALTGERFDNIPDSFHKSNLIWDAGFKLSYSLGASRRAALAAGDLVSSSEVARLMAELEASEKARLAAEQAAREAREMAERERLAGEAATREVREAAQARERALTSLIPTIYFADNSKKINPEYEAALEQALAILQQYPDFNLEIHTYCSRSGSISYNNMLSKQRMEAICEWFIARGIPAERLNPGISHGVDNSTRSYQLARRAELRFVK